MMKNFSPNHHKYAINMDDFGHHGWGMGWGWILGFLILLLLIWLVVKLAGRNGRSAGSAEKSAMDILKERYARGEINEEEYNKRKKDIM